MSEDSELLRRYAEENSEEAFAELVRRHVNLVYFAALRQVGGDAHRAKDVAQSVFTDLARKARPLSRHAVLTGWLYTSTHYAAAKAVRSEVRRQKHEYEAHTMNEMLHSSAAGADWDQLRPVLDAVMLELNERDREAVLLRFFEGRPFADVGGKLRVTEDAARMRVDRALNRLRDLLQRRGVTSTTAALAVALGGQASVATPAGLALAVTGAALSGAASPSAAGILALLTMNKLPFVLTSAIAVAGATGLVVQQNANARMRDELAGLQQQNQSIVQLQQDNLRLARTAAEVAALRSDDAELARLQSETTALKAQLDKAAADAAALAAAKRAKEEQARAAAGASPALELSQLDQIPRPTFQKAPVYPVELRKAGAQAAVVVSFIVDSNGGVQNVTLAQIKPIPGADGTELDPEVRQSLPMGSFGTAAIEAVSQWKFDPGVKGGRMVNTRMQVPIVFTTGPKEVQTGTPTPQEAGSPEVKKTGGWF